MVQKEELLACVIARLVARLSDGPAHVAVGAASPIPASACELLRAQGLPLRISMLHRRRANPFTEGSRELFDLAGQGRIDFFFLGGAQIDGAANINLVQAEGRRFPGSFGSAFMYFTCRTILFREEHSRRVLVPQVDFISAPGSSADDVVRPGGPAALVTGKALFAWQKARRRFALQSVHPGHTLDEVREATGFEFDVGDIAETPAPSQHELDLLRGAVARRIVADYPDFARRVWASTLTG
ncbi:MAG TPA: CoA-transferase [Burkholderiales bacterium]